MKVGEPFNPKGIFKGIYVPDAICRDHELSSGAKVCYGRLCWFCDQDGNVEAAVTEIAAAIGLHERQTRTYLAELDAAGLIRRLIRGGQKTNAYEFLWDERLSRSLRKGSEAKSTRQDPAGHSESTRQCLVPNTAGHLGVSNNVLRSREVEREQGDEFSREPVSAQKEPMRLSDQGDFAYFFDTQLRHRGLQGEPISKSQRDTLRNQEAEAVDQEQYRRALCARLDHHLETRKETRNTLGRDLFGLGDEVERKPRNNKSAAVAQRKKLTEMSMDREVLKRWREEAEAKKSKSRP